MHIMHWFAKAFAFTWAKVSGFGKSVKMPNHVLKRIFGRVVWVLKAHVNHSSMWRMHIFLENYVITNRFNCSSKDILHIASTDTMLANIQIIYVLCLLNQHNVKDLTID